MKCCAKESPNNKLPIFVVLALPSSLAILVAKHGRGNRSW